MKVWILWEHYCECFDIVSNEHHNIISVHSSEESALDKQVESEERNKDRRNISYYYEEHEVL